MTLIKNHEFALAWWRISKDELRIPKSQKDDPNVVAWTVNGASPTEIKQITRWCSDNNVLKVSRLSKWHDAWYDKDGGMILEFVNNEMTVITDEETGARFDAWLKSLPKRNAAVLLEGVKRSQINKWTAGYNVRIIPELYQDMLYVVSLGNDELAVELALRSD